MIRNEIRMLMVYYTKQLSKVLKRRTILVLQILVHHPFLPPKIGVNCEIQRFLKSYSLLKSCGFKRYQNLVPTLFYHPSPKGGLSIYQLKIFVVWYKKTNKGLSHFIFPRQSSEGVKQKNNFCRGCLVSNKRYCITKK